MKQNLKLLIYTLLGNTMLAFAVCAFIVPQDFMLGAPAALPCRSSASPPSGFR